MVGAGLLLGLSSQKGGGAVGGRCGRMAVRTGFFWESLGSMEQDYFGILSFQSKIFACKTLDYKSFKSQRVGYYVS